MLSESRSATETKKVKPTVIYVEVPEMEDDDDETGDTEGSYDSEDSSEVDEEFDPTKQVNVDIHVYHHSTKKN